MPIIPEVSVLSIQPTDRIFTFDYAYCERGNYGKDYNYLQYRVEA